MLLGPLVEKVLSGSSPMIPFSAVQGSMAAYHDIFMKCRHWVNIHRYIRGGDSLMLFC